MKLLETYARLVGVTFSSLINYIRQKCSTVKMCVHSKLGNYILVYSSLISIVRQCYTTKNLLKTRGGGRLLFSSFVSFCNTKNLYLKQARDCFLVF